MNCFYKYIIYFLLGIIIYSLIFKKSITEGLTPEELETKIQTHTMGCHNYTCKNNEATYDNYEPKLYVGDERYHNCANINDNQYIISNPDLIPCSNEICCDNHICNTNKSDVEPQCGNATYPNTIFMPNMRCRYSSDPSEQSDTCNAQTCCRPIINDRGGSQITDGTTLFDNIINFRDLMGGNSDNGQQITGEDIRNYLYYSLLDLVAIDIINNPLSLESRTTNHNNITFFKNYNDGGIRLDIISDDGSGYCSYGFKSYFDYPSIGKKLANNISLTDIANNKEIRNSCIEGYYNPTNPNQELQKSIYPYLDNKDDLYYSDYDKITDWISTLDTNNKLDRKLILIPELENNYIYDETTVNSIGTTGEQYQGYISSGGSGIFSFNAIEDHTYGIEVNPCSRSGCIEKRLSGIDRISKSSRASGTIDTLDDSFLDLYSSNPLNKNDQELLVDHIVGNDDDPRRNAMTYGSYIEWTCTETNIFYTKVKGWDINSGKFLISIIDLTQDETNNYIGSNPDAHPEPPPDLRLTNDLRNLLKLFNNSYNIDSSSITRIDIKKFIQDLNKNIESHDLNIKPLDRFYHTYRNQNKYSIIDKNIFLGLINQ